jgi:hypothetical protein
LETFFEYRFTLKTAILILVLFGLINSFYPAFQIYGVHFMAIQTLILFFTFELAYEFAGLKFDAIYNRIYTIILEVKGSKLS